jgi:hypothetical protein
MASKFSPVSVKELVQRYGIRHVIFGDTHGFLDDSAVQSSLFKQLHPEFYLHEMIEEQTFLTPDSLQKVLSHKPCIEKYRVDIELSTSDQLFVILFLILFIDMNFASSPLLCHQSSLLQKVTNIHP